MTNDRHGIGHVLDAIDNALWDWTESPDAMTVQYGDRHGEDGASGDVAASPEHCPGGDTLMQDGRRLDSFDDVDLSRPWQLVPGENTPPLPADEWRGWPEDWRNVGWLDGDAPAAFRRDVEFEEITTLGSSVPLRIIATEAVPSGVVVIARTPEALNDAFDLTPYLQGASFGFSARRDSLDIERVSEGVRGLAEACRLAADTVHEHYAPRFTELGRAIRLRADSIAAAETYAWNAMFYGLDENGHPNDRRPTLQGIVPSAGSVQDPRQRALEARRSRNTGPARNPHRHRGI